MKKTLVATFLVLSLILCAVTPVFATEGATATRISDYFLDSKDYYTLHAAKTAEGYEYGKSGSFDDQWTGVLSFAWTARTTTASGSAGDAYDLGYKNNGNSEFRMMWDEDYLYIMLDKLNSTATITYRYNLIIDEAIADCTQSCYVDVEYANGAAVTNYTKNTVSNGVITEGTEIGSSDENYPEGLQTVVRTGKRRNGVDSNYTWETRIPWSAIHGKSDFTVDASTKVGFAVAWTNTAATISTPTSYFMSGMGNGVSCWAPLALGCNDVIVPDTSWFNPEATELYISDAADLYGLSMIVSDVNTSSTNNNVNTIKNITAGKTFYLTNDIDMNPGWTYNAETQNSNIPSNFWYSMAAFAGTLDGQGHTVSGLYNNGSANKWHYNGTSETSINKYPVGFTSDLNGLIKDVAFVDGWFNTGYATASGAIGGTMQNGCVGIENIYVDIDVSAEPYVYGTANEKSRTGGVFGGTYSDNKQETYMRNVVYAGTVTTNYQTDKTYDESKATPTGGLIANNNNVKLTVEDCLFVGKIIEKGYVTTPKNEFFGNIGAAGLLTINERNFAVVTVGTGDARYTRDVNGVVVDGTEATLGLDYITEVEKSDLAADNMAALMNEDYYFTNSNLNIKWTYENTTGTIVPMAVAEVLNSKIYVQRTASVNGLTSVRLLAGLDGLNWEEVGAKITLTYGGVTKNIDATENDNGDGIVTTKTVWSSIYANNELVNASDLNGSSYVYGIVINNVPDVDVVITVSLYKLAEDGETVVEGVRTVTINVADVPAPTATPAS